MADESLLLLIKEVRGKTLRMLDGLGEEEARFSPPGLNNSMLWHAGHALIVNEHLGLSSAEGRAPAFPEGWFDKFSWKSQPATITDWPAVADVAARLREQLERLAAAVQNLSDEQLAKVIDPGRNRTLRYAILHGLHDEAQHQGEMWLLKKLYAKRLGVH
ncbi:MAG TPA: DinB family protein [Tepidisphaeraceae bacterium]